VTTEQALSWVASVFEDPTGRIGRDTKKDDIPGWDSLGTLTLIAALDSEFGIQLAEKELYSMSVVEDILAVLRRNGTLQDE